MPGYWAPWPGNRKATGRPRASRRRRRGARGRGPRAPPRPRRGRGRPRRAGARSALAADLEGVGDVGQRRASGCSSQVRGQAVGGRLQGRRRSRAESIRSCAAGATGPDGSARRRLLQDDVGVGAADAEGADAGAPGRAVRPARRRSAVVDVERACREVDLAGWAARSGGSAEIAGAPGRARS